MKIGVKYFFNSRTAFKIVRQPDNYHESTKWHTGLLAGTKNFDMSAILDKVIRSDLTFSACFLTFVFGASSTLNSNISAPNGVSEKLFYVLERPPPALFIIILSFVILTILKAVITNWRNILLLFSILFTKNFWHWVIFKLKYLGSQLSDRKVIICNGKVCSSSFRISPYFFYFNNS